MKKLPISIFFLISLSIYRFLIPSALTAAPIYAQENSKIGHWQIIHYGETVLENLDYTGYITLDGTTITNSANINGYTHIRFSNLHQLSVKGHLMIEDSIVSKKAEITGDMLAINVQFKENIVCQSPKIVLKHCRVRNLIIKSMNEPEEQIVQLSETSEIFGTIFFESGRGKVVATIDSVPGKIRGGTLELAPGSK